MLFALLDFTKDNFISMLAWYLIFVISVTLHEAAHAWMGWKLGDSTAHDGGQVTINPIPHVEREPIGALAVPLLSFWFNGFMIGWASAPYDPYWAIRYPWRKALVSLAGPLANLLLVLIAVVIIRIGLAQGIFAVSYEGSIFTNLVEPIGTGMVVGGAKLVSILFSLNLLLFLFNLMPIPPMDGGSLIIPFLSPLAAARYREFVHQPMISMMGIMLAWILFPRLFLAIFPMIERILFSGYL